MRWNETLYYIPSSPVLIYHDEIAIDSSMPFQFRRSEKAGELVCGFDKTRANWHYPNGTRVQLTNINSRVFQQIRNTGKPSRSRLSIFNPTEAQNLTGANFNGLWTCRKSGAAQGSIPVGIYHRGGGRSLLQTRSVVDSNFLVSITLIIAPNRKW